MKPLIWLVAALTALSAHAQDLTYDLEPFKVDSVGLSINLPTGAETTTTWAGHVAKVQVYAADATWIVEIQSDQPSDPEATPVSFTDGIIAHLKNANGGRGEVSDRIGLHQIGGRPADAFSFRFPKVGNEPVRIYSYAVIFNRPDQVVTLTLITTEDQFQQANLVFKGLLKTAAFSDPMLVEAKRGLAIANLERLRATLSDADLDAILTGDVERWQRLYKPAPGMLDADAIEYGYKRFRSWRGRRGELDPGRERSRWSASDHDTGILVRLDARLLEPTHMIDSTSTCFLSDDAQSEAWNTVAAIKPRTGNERPAVWRETGARAGLNLTVRVEGAGMPTETITATIPEKGYVSQAESFLLSELLVRHADKTTYGAYVYRPARNAIQYRSDTIERLDDGRVQITSVHEQGQPPTVSVFTPDADLVSQALDRERIWAPIDLNRLVGLWRSKNLPMD